MGNLWPKVPPWRTVGSDGNWNLQNQQKLIEDINSIEIPGKGTEFRVLLVGFVHSGKSSFINSVASIDKNRIADAAPSAEGGEGSTTTKLLVYKTKHLIQKVCLIDVMGLEEQTGEGLNHEDVNRILCGEIETGYEFQPKTIDNQNRFYIANADMRWEAHCCVIVIDAEQVLIGSIPERIIDQIELIKKYINAHNNRRVVLLTKTDRLCRDVQNVFESRKVKEAVDKARLKFAVPIHKTDRNLGHIRLVDTKGFVDSAQDQQVEFVRKILQGYRHCILNIYPVKNYSHEMGLDTNMDILVLMAIRNIVGLADDFVKQREDENYGSEIVHHE